MAEYSSKLELCSFGLTKSFLKVRFLAKPKRINSLWSFGLTKSFLKKNTNKYRENSENFHSFAGILTQFFPVYSMKCTNKICLACSAGGHLRELLLAVGSIPERYDCYWLTLKTPATKAFMKGKDHVFLTNFQPAKRWTLLVNAMQALYWVLVKRPAAIITTGAGVTVPTVFFAKKLLGTKIIFINSAADVTAPSRTPVWIEKYADLFLIQWEDLRAVFPNAIHCGVL